jgi:hypothetical protein
MTDEARVEESKFDLGSEPGPPVDTGELPWSYGGDRVTAIVRDPDSAYLYWEITDEAIGRARERLGPSGGSGWCNLRIYDTTGRDFDGTNANDYFDIQVDRNDREYFLMIRRPNSTIQVEVGIKSHEGYFQSIARSGRAEFPRNDPSPNTFLEWMTVTSDGAPPAATPCRSRYSGSGLRRRLARRVCSIDARACGLAAARASIAQWDPGTTRAGGAHRTVVAPGRMAS